jgi:hypothetical protein
MINTMYGMGDNRLAPVDIVVQDLYCRRLDASCRLLGHCDENRWIGLANHVAFLPFPLKLVAYDSLAFIIMGSALSPLPLPLKGPSERDRTGVLQFDDQIRVEKF